PFGAVASAAVVGMIGVVVYQRVGLPSVSQQTASVAATDDSQFSEIDIIASPKLLNSSAAEPSRKKMSLARPAPAVDAVQPMPRQQALKPIERKLSVRLSAPATVPVRQRVTAVSQPLAAPHAPQASLPSRMTKAESNSYSTVPIDVSSKPAPTPTPLVMAKAANPPAFVGGPGGGLGNEVASLRTSQAAGRTENANSVDATAKTNYPETAFSPAPSVAARAAAPALPAPAPVPNRLAVTSAMDNYRTDELQPVPAVRSLLDMALQQRRQRSLFSYATR
ncbi:MAG: hypothetical protein V4671_08925, partial [Armatimonadota bacterium]